MKALFVLLLIPALAFAKARAEKCSGCSFTVALTNGEVAITVQPPRGYKPPADLHITRVAVGMDEVFKKEPITRNDFKSDATVRLACPAAHLNSNQVVEILFPMYGKSKGVGEVIVVMWKYCSPSLVKPKEKAP
jgi:hypothetical protein